VGEIAILFKPNGKGLFVVLKKKNSGLAVSEVGAWKRTCLLSRDVNAYSGPTGILTKRKESPIRGNSDRGEKDPSTKKGLEISCWGTCNPVVSVE